MLSGGFDLPVIKTMQIIGAGRRKNMVCPGCNSTDRDRLMYFFLEKNKLLKNNISLLHIAPEPSLGTFLKSNVNGLYISGAKYHEGVYYHDSMKIIDIEALTFESNSFDMVICNHVLEHVADDHQAMAEIYRVLKSGGAAILQVPWSPLLETTYEDPSIIDQIGREKHFGQFDHVRLYGMDYRKRLENGGFHVSTFSVQDLLETTIEKKNFALNPQEIIFVGRKQTTR